MKNRPILRVDARKVERSFFFFETAVQETVPKHLCASAKALCKRGFAFLSALPFAIMNTRKEIEAFIAREGCRNEYWQSNIRYPQGTSIDAGEIWGAVSRHPANGFQLGK